LIVVVPFVFVSSTPELFIASLIWPLASVAREAIDEVARAKKEAIDRIQDATTEEKEAAKAKVH
jgi:hypothetical protein